MGKTVVANNLEKSVHWFNRLKSVYVIKPEYSHEISTELTSDFEVIGDIVLSANPPQQVCFALDIWLNPYIMKIQSISDAAKHLKRLGKYWTLHPLHCIRRSRLIEAQLRRPPSQPLIFPSQEQPPKVGEFCLLDEHTLVCGFERFKPWPSGKCLFVEDKVNPPNRAYLKLWEALSLFDVLPQPGETALDLGASPGGWSYVMHALGVHVTAVDKAPLAPSIAKRPGIRYLKESAFSIRPEAISVQYDWLCCDVACYPDRAYALILNWIKSGKAKRLIVTIKLQGQIDMSLIKTFQSIPNARVLQLWHNKHEVTFLYPFTVF